MSDELQLTELDLTVKDGSAVHLANEAVGDIWGIVFSDVRSDLSLNNSLISRQP